MAWLSEFLAALIARLLKEFGHEVGTTKAEDAVKDRALLVRAGSRVHAWLQAHGAGDRGQPPAGGSGDDSPRV